MRFSFRWALLLVFLLPFYLVGCTSWGVVSAPPTGTPPVESPASTEQERKAKKPQPEVEPVKQVETEKKNGKKVGQTVRPNEDILLPPAPIKPPAVGGSGG